MAVIARLDFEVTADDIENGEKGIPCSCPIALAIARTMGYARGRSGFVSIDSDSIRFRYQDRSAGTGRRGLPRKMSRFINSFDDGKPVKPFKFSLTLKMRDEIDLTPKGLP